MDVLTIVGVVAAGGTVATAVLMAVNNSIARRDAAARSAQFDAQQRSAEARWEDQQRIEEERREPAFALDASRILTLTNLSALPVIVVSVAMGEVLLYMEGAFDRLDLVRRRLFKPTESTGLYLALRSPLEVVKAEVIVTYQYGADGSKSGQLTVSSF